MVNNSFLSDLTITDFKIYTRTFQEPYIEEMHRPYGLYGFSFAIDGEVIYHHNGKTYVSDRDHVILYPQGKDYVMECTKPGVFTIVNFNATGYEREEFLSLKIPNVEKFIKDHEVMTKLESLNLPSCRLEILSILYNTLARIVKHTNSADSYPALWSAVDYIRDNIRNCEMTVKDMSTAVGFSEVHFRKLFKDSYGISPKQYLQNLRLDMAKNLLETGNVSISGISEECGYSSIYYFSKLFKEKTGYSPFEYRERFRKIY